MAVELPTRLQVHNLAQLFNFCENVEELACMITIFPEDQALELANSIIDRKGEIGGFFSAEDISSVPGLDEKSLLALYDEARHAFIGEHASPVMGQLIGLPVPYWFPPGFEPVNRAAWYRAPTEWFTHYSHFGIQLNEKVRTLTERWVFLVKTLQNNKTRLKYASEAQPPNQETIDATKNRIKNILRDLGALELEASFLNQAIGRRDLCNVWTIVKRNLEEELKEQGRLVERVLDDPNALAHARDKIHLLEQEIENVQGELPC